MDINAIQNAFSVEQLSKEFFEKYKKQFDKFWRFIASNDEYKKLFLANESEKKELKIRDFTKKLLGRIVFLHFLQKKGWMGCTAGIKEWEDGDKQFMQTLFENYSNQTEFHSKCLAELFYNTLNKRRKDDIFVCDGLEGVLSKSKVPYLNGGLFDSDESITRKIDFPASYFQELFDFFGQYNFTIDENDPNDHEVGIDPEMLGHIFENLLEDNKDKGAFYTPKVIVQYMCQESIIEYINTKINESEDTEVKSAIEELVRNRLFDKCSILELVEPIANALHNVKICDPAIGSGAFPMGILNVIYQTIEELWFNQPDSVSSIWEISDTDWEPHLVKKNIIQHSIYGVDLESGAVDIARLRFWLALVVDEIEPLPLPNLDYKIMQGNSLLESFEGIDLSQISDASAYEEIYDKTKQIDIFSGEAKKSVSISLSFEDIESLMDEYFNANDPETKKTIHKKIDDQVLNHIRFTLLQHKQSLIAKKTPLERKLKLDIVSAVNSQQIEKIKTTSKTAKELAKISSELEMFNEKEIKLAQLSNSNERPFFLWHLFYKEVFDEGGFDIIIGNPPYVLISKEEFDKEYKQYYHLQEGKIDLYRLFTELSLKLIKHRGTFSFIIPNTILTIPSCKILRNYLLENTEIKKILNFEIDIFKSASVNSIILISSIGKAKNNFINVNANESISNIFKYKFEKMSQNRFLENDKHEINIYISEKDYFLLNKIYQKSSNLNQLGYEVSLGTQVYHNTLHSEDQIKDRFLHSSFPKNDLYELELGGRKINQFSVKMEGDFVDFSSEFYTKPHDKFFFGQKVILREITGKTLIATYSEERFVVNKSCYSIYHNDKIMLKALTGLLNSQLIGFVTSKLGDKSNQKLFPRITMNMINNIPVYFGGKESEIASIVDNLSLNGNSNNFEELLSLDKIIYNLFELDSDEIKSIGEN